MRGSETKRVPEICDSSPLTDDVRDEKKRLTVTHFINAPALDAFDAAAIGVGDRDGGDAFKAGEEPVKGFGGFTQYGRTYQVNTLTTL